MSTVARHHAFDCLRPPHRPSQSNRCAHPPPSLSSPSDWLPSFRLGEAQAQLLDLVSHEDVTPEACLAGLQAALQAPSGTPLARSAADLCACALSLQSECVLKQAMRMEALVIHKVVSGPLAACFMGAASCPLPACCHCRAALSMVLERFSEDPSLVVELVRTALQAVASSGSKGGGEGDGGGASELGQARAAQGQAATAPAAAEVEELVLELVGDDRLMESVCEDSSSQRGGPPLRRQLLSLLWNHAVRALGGGTAYAAAHAFFSAALQLLQRARGGGGPSQDSESEREAASQEGQPQAVVCCRSLALCCLGTGEHDRWGQRWYGMALGTALGKACMHCTEYCFASLLSSLCRELALSLCRPRTLACCLTSTPSLSTCPPASGPCSIWRQPSGSAPATCPQPCCASAHSWLRACRRTRRQQ